VLVNNAGIMTTRYRESPDGIELTFATNYVGPFLLTLLLLERLLQPASEPADRRIVNVASAVHNRARLPLEPATAAGFSGMQAYAQSKLGNIMFTLTLAERLNGSGVTVNCLHPGVVATNITGSANPLLRLGARLAAPFMLDAERGAATSIYLATDPTVDGISGGYFDEHQRQVAPAPAALDRGARETLWNWSVTFCGVSDIASRLDRHQDAGGHEP
jgi:NAD(P)-dependent dehydrogenase (short-subunit alcohol dehydrogenase family)